MKKFHKVKYLYFLRQAFSLCVLIIITITLLSNIKFLFFNKPNNNFIEHRLPHEQYDSSLSNLNSMDKVVEFIELEVNKQILTGIEIPIFVDDFLRKRFHHKTNYLNHTNNWLLLFLNKLFPNKGLLGALDPEHIIKEVYGSCSQQAIIFQEIIKTFGFEYSSIGINAEIINGENFGHFISAVKMDDKWYIFDTNLEPIYDRHDSEITSRLLTGDYETLKSLYPYTNFSDLSPPYNIVLRDQNSFPATNGLMFQKFTALVSNYIWLVLAIIALYIRKKI